MAISVIFMPLLAKRAKSRAERLSVEFTAGLTPMDIALGEGFSTTDAEALMVLVNNTQAELDTGLKDGDQVELMVGIQGG